MGLFAQSYSVGVKSYFIEDHSRLTEGLAYRPILINMWYPGEADKRKDYITIRELNSLPGTDTTTSKFSEFYYKYVLKNLDQTLFSSLDIVDSVWKANELNKYLSLKTNAKRELEPVKTNKFPLVVFHQGLGGTMDDNYVLCELLAQNGFVVVGSTFFSELAGMSPGNYDFSRRDVNMIINELSRYPNIDLKRIYYIGHSYGAQAGFTIMSQEGCPIGLFLLMDTTFDHNDDQTLDELWHYLMPAIKEGYSKVRVPSYHFVSKRNGNNYNVPKRHIYSDRKIVTTKTNISHNSFVSVGHHEAKLVKNKLPDIDMDTTYYPRINKVILDILTLWPNDMEHSVMDTQYFDVQYLQAFKPVQNMSEYMPIINRLGLDSTLNFLHQVNQLDPSTRDELGWLVDLFLSNGDLVTAEKIADYYLMKHPQFWRAHFAKGKIMVEKKVMEEAKTQLKMAFESTKIWYNRNEVREYCEEKEISFKN